MPASPTAARCPRRKMVTKRSLMMHTPLSPVELTRRYFLFRIIPTKLVGFTRLLLPGWPPSVRWRQRSSTTQSLRFSLSKVDRCSLLLIVAHCCSLLIIVAHCCSLSQLLINLTLTGPSNVWFGVGFNAGSMADKPYAVIVDGHGKVIMPGLVTSLW